MPESRIRVAPSTVAYADAENLELVVEFAIPGAPTDTIDVKILDHAPEGVLEELDHLADRLEETVMTVSRVAR